VRSVTPASRASKITQPWYRNPAHPRPGELEKTAVAVGSADGERRHHEDRREGAGVAGLVDRGSDRRRDPGVGRANRGAADGNGVEAAAVPSCDRRRRVADRDSRPTTRRVIRVFGSWSEAIEAAGFTPRQSGRPRRSGQPSAPTRRSPPNDIEQAYALPIASAELSRRVEKVVSYPPLVEMDGRQRREFPEALLDSDSFEDLPGKWQAAILDAEQNRPKLRLITGE
jgi:hypothetical protein